MKQPETWSVEQAIRFREETTARLESRRSTSLPLIETPVRLALRWAHGIGLPVYDRQLERVARRMNQNLDSAFNQYSPGSGDVVVSAYFKAGTNWVMHICHQICHLGQGEFGHIQDVIPWPDAAQPRFWINIHDRSAYNSPTGLRVIKSHLDAGRIPINAAAKYIAVTRDPKDCAASGYHFFRDILFGPTMPPPDLWLNYFTNEKTFFGRWDNFTASWYALRKQPNVLFLRFEDIKQDTQKIRAENEAASAGSNCQPIPSQDRACQFH